MSRKLNGIIKEIILYICVEGLTSKTPTGRENCSLISMIYQIFRETSTIVIVVTKYVSNVA